MGSPVREPEATVLDELVAANRILFHQGVVDGFGHVSLRHPADPGRFLLSRSMAPALVQPSDILAFDLDGKALGDDARPPYLERFIHAEIYRARPDVGAVVHSHSPSMIPFGATRGMALRPICHMSGFLAPAAPVFEIRDHAGEASDLLIRDGALGRALAGALAGHAVVLMRGHGSTVVGRTLRQAVFRAIYAEVNARLQSEAMRLGAPIFLTDGEARRASATNDGQIDRAWELWRLQAARHGLRQDG